MSLEGVEGVEDGHSPGARGGVGNDGGEVVRAGPGSLQAPYDQSLPGVVEAGNGKGQQARKGGCSRGQW